MDSFVAIAFPCWNFCIVFSFRTIANSDKLIRRPCADAAKEFTRLTSYLAFSLFSFFYDNAFAIGCISLLTITVKTEGFFKLYIYIMQPRIVVIEQKFITILFGMIRNTN